MMASHHQFMFAIHYKVCIDQGSDGWSAAYYLMSLGVNLLLLFDWSHRTWNDVQLAIGDARFSSVCLLMIIVLNLDHGPYASHRWWLEMVQGAQQYTTQVANHNDLLFQENLPNINIDEGGDANEYLEEHEQEAKFAALGECVDRKLLRVGMCRWFQFISSMTLFLPMWTKRWTICLYCALQMGLFIKGRAAVGLTVEVRAED